MIEQEKIGEFLKSLRKAKGLTQSEVADALYVSPKSVSRWESGDGLPDISIISSVADLYGVTVDEILKGEKINADSSSGEATKIKNAKNYSKLIKTSVTRKYFRSFIASLIVLGSSIAVAIVLALFGLGLPGFILFISGMIVSPIINIIGKNNSNVDLDDFEEDEIPYVKEGMANGQKQIKKNFMIFWDVFVGTTVIFAVYMLFFSKFYYFEDALAPLFLDGLTTQWIVDIVWYGVLLAVSYIPARVIFAKYQGKERLLKLRKALSWCFVTYMLYFLTFQFGVIQSSGAPGGWDYNNMFALSLFFEENAVIGILTVLCIYFFLMSLVIVAAITKKPDFCLTIFIVCALMEITWIICFFSIDDMGAVLIFDLFEAMALAAEIVLIVIMFIVYKKWKQTLLLEKKN